MYAIDFTDAEIHKITYSNKSEFETYKTAESFEEAKELLICYLENMINDTKSQLKQAKKLKE